MSSGPRTLHLTFRDRRDAGAALGKELLKRGDWQDPVVLALAPGGVPVAAEVARELDAPLDVLVPAGPDRNAERERLYRGEHLPPVPVEGREVILVDDSVATGATMRAAVQAVRPLAPSRVVIAVPVGASESCEALRSVADGVVCARTPEPFGGVAQWYSEFPNTSEQEVRSLIATTRRHVES
jgi:putative phosphoribosyl transferase